MSGPSLRCEKMVVKQTLQIVRVNQSLQTQTTKLSFDMQMGVRICMTLRRVIFEDYNIMSVKTNKKFKRIVKTVKKLKKK